MFRLLLQRYRLPYLKQTLSDNVQVHRHGTQQQRQ